MDSSFSALGEFQQLECGVHRARDAIHFAELGAEAGAFPAQFLGALGLAPHGLLFQLQADFLEALALAVVLKGTPSRTARAPRDLSMPV